MGWNGEISAQIQKGNKVNIYDICYCNTVKFSADWTDWRQKVFCRPTKNKSKNPLALTLPLCSLHCSIFFTNTVEVSWGLSLLSHDWSVLSFEFEQVRSSAKIFIITLLLTWKINFISWNYAFYANFCLVISTISPTITNTACRGMLNIQ